jgi:hypothetical protein
MPERCRSETQRLAMGYDQLALEVATRMSVIEQRRHVASGRSPHAGLAPARFIDTPA